MSAPIVRIYIMAVPWDPQRTKRAVALHKATGGTIIWDQLHNAMDTFGRLLDQVIADGDGPFMILQDDVQLTEGWLEKVQAVIGPRAEHVVQLFSMNPNDLILGSRWVDGKAFISNLCVYFPAFYASQLREFAPVFLERYPQFATADDFVVRYFLRGRREQFWLQTPSLVQHEPWVSAINAKRPRNRRSHNFDGEQVVL
jgi:hypothetical protein